MLDLESAIKHCEEVAQNKEEDAEKWRYTLNDYRKRTSCEPKTIPICERELKECLNCASEHRQLAEWLKELERYRKVRKILSQNRIATDRYGEVVLWDDIKRVLTEVKSDDAR